ncbi:hypothetical protein [Chryseobacterium sp. S90]|uniref:hypothetical protein n=2 Tax=unclassified Chryseobacterium TaxID=2593645 RepID=UPI0039BCBB65
MKKLLFIAMVGMAGFASAKENVEKVNSKAKETKTIKKAKKKTQMQCGTFQASCTSAYTCQDWSAGQWIEWAEKIQDNYCQL